MRGLAMVLAAVAALAHVGIFWLESIAWMRPSTRRIFGIATEEEARTTRLLAYNQGFYNLFLAAMAAAGVVLLAAGSGAGSVAAGAALVFAGCGAMAAAAVVLLSATRSYARAAALQGAVPLAAVAALALSL